MVKNSKNLSARTLFAPNEALSALAAPFLTPVSRTVDGNVQGAKTGARTPLFALVAPLFTPRTSFLAPNRLFEFWSIVMLFPQMP